MNEILKGNFKTKNKVSSSESAKDDSLENRFDKAALKKLGGRIAFVSKNSVLLVPQVMLPMKFARAWLLERKEFCSLDDLMQSFLKKVTKYFLIIVSLLTNNSRIYVSVGETSTFGRGKGMSGFLKTKFLDIPILKWRVNIFL